MVFNGVNITTSYFGNIRNVQNPLSIAGKAPDWYNGPQFKHLAPKYDFYKKYKDGVINELGYTQEYYDRVLDAYTPESLVRTLMYKFGNEITLLCYEKPGEFCHRRLVANFLQNGTGLVVPEL